MYNKIPYYPVFAALSFKWSLSGRLKTKENFKLLALKVVAVAHERRSFTRAFKYVDLTWKLLIWNFGKQVAEERWSLTRGCRNRRFDCRKIMPKF